MQRGETHKVDWLQNTVNKENTTGGMLPDINDRGLQRRRTNQGGAGMGKAAGFNRNDFNSTADHSQKKGGILGQELTVAGGMGTGLLGAHKTLEQTQPIDTISPAMGKPQTPKRMRFTQALNDTAITQERPPLYVPTNRTAQRRESKDNYQPSLLQKQSSIETGHVLDRKPTLRDSSESRRYQPTQAPNVVPVIKGPGGAARIGGPKMEAPPAATFAVKTVQEKQSQ